MHGVSLEALGCRIMTAMDVRSYMSVDISRRETPIPGFHMGPGNEASDDSALKKHY